MDWTIFLYFMGAVASGAVTYLAWPKHRRRRSASQGSTSGDGSKKDTMRFGSLNDIASTRPHFEFSQMR